MAALSEHRLVARLAALMADGLALHLVARSVYLLVENLVAHWACLKVGQTAAPSAAS